jgi:hypothetical protein
MPNPDSPGLAREWVTLQNNSERYERDALLIKLVAVLAWGGSLALGRHALLAAVMVLILWVQEGILRTCQARLGTRMLRVESLLAGNIQGPAFQLYSEWLAVRPGMAGLLVEYARSALRPTVVFPYAVLLLIGLARHLV